MIAQTVRAHQEESEELERLQEENMRLHGELEDIYTPTNIIGTSKAMRSVYTLISHVADTESTVLIRGESGVGKELVANAIHYSSNRRDKPFIKINCYYITTILPFSIYYNPSLFLNNEYFFVFIVFF